MPSSTMFGFIGPSKWSPSLRSATGVIQGSGTIDFQTKREIAIVPKKVKITADSSGWSWLFRFITHGYSALAAMLPSREVLKVHNDL